MNTPDIPKVTIQHSNMNIQNEVQDFSMGPKKSNHPPQAASSASTSNIGGKGKLDDMLSKLMKKKNAVSFYLLNYIDDSLAYQARPGGLDTK